MRQDDPSRYSMNRLPISEDALEARRPLPLDVRFDLLADVCHLDRGPTRRIRVVRTNGTGPRALDIFLDPLDPLSGAEVHDEVVER